MELLLDDGKSFDNRAGFFDFTEKRDFPYLLGGSATAMYIVREAWTISFAGPRFQFSGSSMERHGFRCNSAHF